MFKLSGKVILVIGGRGYLGRDFCHILHSQDATVISADLPNESNAVNKSTPVESSDEIVQFDIDVTDRSSINKIVELVVNKYKRIDTLVYSVTSKPYDFYNSFTECSLEGWQDVIKVELDGLFMVAQEVGKKMELQNSGNLILLSSIYGVVGNDQRIYEDSNLENLYVDKKGLKSKKIYSHSVYPVVKGGVISLVRYLAAYWGEKNIRVNSVSPGGVFHEKENEEFVAKYSKKVPLGRKAKVDEISGAIVFLASDDSSYINGQNLIIDGGFTSW